MNVKVDIIGRKPEIKTLRESLYSSESQFIAVYGRRRVGKTYLIRRTFLGDFAFQYTGIEKKNNRQQLDAFHLTMLQQGLPKCRKPANWIEAFDQLQTLLEGKSGSERNNGKKVVFLDELPWMDAPRSDFVEALGHFWNQWAAWTDDIVLVICGSSTSWIFNKVFRNHGGLYNRVTRQIPLYPFNLSECEEMCRSMRLGWNRMQMAEAYMIMGGIPHYWKKFEANQSLPANIDRLFFEKNADMRMEYKALYSSMFSKPELYEKTVDALCSHKSGLTRKEIADMTGIGRNGKLTDILENLELCGFITKVSQPKKRNRDAIYQLDDNFSLFYHEFLKDKNLGSDYWSSHLMSARQSAWAGLAFERLCFQHKPQISAKLGISGVYKEWYAWQAPKSEEYPGMQIDMVIDRADGIVNICEAKFSSKPFAISEAYLEEMNLRRERFHQEVAPQKEVRLTMLTANGIAQNPQKFEVNSSVELKDLFKNVNWLNISNVKIYKVL